MDWNPVAARDFRENLPKARTFMVRSAFVAALVPPIVAALLTRRSALEARATFRLLMDAELVLVSLFAPVFTADLLSSERRNLTLGLLHLAGLSSREIVVGKFVPRLAYLWMLVLCVLPVLILWRMIGSITWGEILAAQGVVLTVGTTGCAVGLFWSSAGRRAIPALTASVLCMAALLGLPPVLREIGALPAGAWWGFWIVSPLEVVEWILSVQGALAGGTARGWQAAAGAALWLVPVLPLLLASAWFADVRRVEGFRLWKSGAAARPGFLASFGLDFAIRLLLPILRKVGGTAAVQVALREARMSRGLGLRGIAWIAAAGTLLQVPFWILTWDWWKDLRNHQAAVGFELYLVGLGATIAAVSSVVQEKESKSMEILLTAPVQPRAIAWGKFYALALSLCALLAMPLAHVCFFAAIGYLSLATPVAFVALVPGAMAFFVAQGLYLSVIARQLVSAQVAGLLAYHAWLVAGAVCPCLLFFLPSMLGWFVAFGIAPGPRLEVFTGLVWWGRLDQGPIFLAILAIPALIITGLILTRLLESAGLRLRPSAKRR